MGAQDRQAEVTSARILVVDDDEQVRDFLDRLLRRTGYEVFLAPDGKGALEICGREVLDLVLLDLGLPGMDGLEVLQRIKQAQGDAYLPVILLTGRDDLTSRLQGLKLGADDYLSKPANAMEILARVEALLRIKRLQQEIAVSRRMLQDQSLQDPETGLYNARYLAERLQDEFKRAERYSEPLSCLALQLGGRGIEAGVEGMGPLLREAAELLRRGMREFDLLARDAPLRFVVLLPRTHFTGALAVATRLWRTLHGHRFRLGHRPAEVEIGMGAAFYPNRDVASADDLFGRAVTALARSLEDGGQAICLFQHTAYFYRPEAEDGVDGSKG